MRVSAALINLKPLLLVNQMAFFHAEIDFEQELGVSFDRDLKVTRVAQGGQGQLKGIQAGFRLLSVEGVSVTNVVDFQLEKRRCEFDGRSKCELEFKVRAHVVFYFLHIKVLFALTNLPAP